MQPGFSAEILDEERFRLKFQIDRLNALRHIDLAINSSFDPYVVLNVILEQVIDHLRVDAAAILLLNPHNQLLEYAAGRGFHTNALQQRRVRLGEGHAGMAALYRRGISIEDLLVNTEDLQRSPLISAERFVEYHVVPLIAKGEVKGTLEVFNRVRQSRTEDWLDSLHAMTVQAAIAIENASLFSALQRSSAELARAYDSTIEGWARALDLRDRETEGHSRRVTDLTLALARACGIDTNLLDNIRWGSLLHDIGKLGIPDHILFKPAALTEQEWVIMRRHPEYAKEILEPIEFLRPAVDIPYAHHEKWDGSGYPRHLGGAQIPLAARLFAVVDVWDSLCSDRPYRSSWMKDRARAYILDQKGKHFDPEIVPAFLEIIDNRELLKTK